MNRDGGTFRLYVGNDGERVPMATLRHYRNLRWHRSTILEGIRRLAVRNINHRVRVMIRLGVGVDTQMIDAKTVFDRLHEDQGMPANVNARPMVVPINTMPWEMYLCLLHAELESYLAASRRDSGLVFPPLEEFLDSRRAVVKDLKKIRDKVLHPANGIMLDDALDSFEKAGTRLDGHYLKLVFDAQRRLDEYCAWLRESLEILVAAERADARRSAQPRRGMRAKLKMATAALTHQLPKFIGEHSLDGLQTPFDRRKWHLLGLNEVIDVEGVMRFPFFVRRAHTDCFRILVWSLVFANEFVHLTDFMKLRTIETPADLAAHKPYAFIQADTDKMSAQQIGDLLAPLRVSNALLSEPLRLYYNVVRDTPELRDGTLEAIAGPGPVPAAFSRYRNVIFHVGPDDPDPSEAESEVVLAMRAGMNVLLLLPRLLRFFAAV